jgi:hypothetical protein
VRQWRGDALSRKGEAMALRCSDPQRQSNDRPCEGLFGVALAKKWNAMALRRIEVRWQRKALGAMAKICCVRLWQSPAMIGFGRALTRRGKARFSQALEKH